MEPFTFLVMSRSWWYLVGPSVGWVKISGGKVTPVWSGNRSQRAVYVLLRAVAKGTGRRRGTVLRGRFRIFNILIAFTDIKRIFFIAANERWCFLPLANTFNIQRKVVGLTDWRCRMPQIVSLISSQALEVRILRHIDGSHVVNQWNAKEPKKVASRKTGCRSVLKVAIYCTLDD